MLQVVQGDCRAVLPTLPEKSVQCVVTSVPYFALRDYGAPPLDWPAVDYCPMPGLPPLRIEPMTCSLGLEPTPEAYTAHLVLIWRALWRVLRSDGTCWLNLGSSYAANRSYQVTDSKWCDVGNTHGSRVPGGYKPKDDLVIPHRVYLALIADGWYGRMDCVWAKGRDGDIDDVGPGNTMPESVLDRPVRSHEYVFLLSKSPRYFFDMEAIKESASPNTPSRGKGTHPKMAESGSGIKQNESWSKATNGYVSSRNARSVWCINSQSYSGAHYAVFPERLAERCILAGSSPQACGAILDDGRVCGAPWERVTERVAGFTNGICNGCGAPRAKHKQGAKSSMRAQEWGKAADSTTMLEDGAVPCGAAVTTGWRPTCPHDDPTGRSVVLDPFFGSGTTGKVALKHGRACIGIELNPAYVEEQVAQRTNNVQTSMISLID